MTRFITALTLLAALTTAIDATTVAVIELGKSGSVHRTLATSPSTSTDGVFSFWKSLHQVNSKSNGKSRHARATQYPGMAVVPDLFSRPDGGIVIGVSGDALDKSSMPKLASLIDGGNAIGHFHIKGDQSRDLMKRLGAKTIETSELNTTLKSKTESASSKDGNKLESLAVRVNSQDMASDVDSIIADSLASLSRQLEESGSTVVVHIVVDEADDVSRRRLLSSRFAKEDEEEEEEAENDDGNNKNNNNNNNKNNNNNNNNNNNGYSIPYYYNDDGELVTPYRTIFQIQYFNVVLWTSVGIGLVIIIANNMLMNMHFMPDTLLFGESAKVVAE
jgi:hypothetical protein